MGVGEIISRREPLPWQSRHKNRRDRATIITIAVAVGIGCLLLVAINLDSIGHILLMFEVH